LNQYYKRQLHLKSLWTKIYICAYPEFHRKLQTNTYLMTIIYSNLGFHVIYTPAFMTPILILKLAVLRLDPCFLKKLNTVLSNRTFPRPCGVLYNLIILSAFGIED
jgi:hypothetical protein